MPAPGRSKSSSVLGPRFAALGPRSRLGFAPPRVFAASPSLAWCEAHGVRYGLGLAKKTRLEAALAQALEQAKERFEQTGEVARVFEDFSIAPARAGAGNGGSSARLSTWLKAPIRGLW